MNTRPSCQPRTSTFRCDRPACLTEVIEHFLDWGVFVNLRGHFSERFILFLPPVLTESKYVG